MHEIRLLPAAVFFAVSLYMRIGIDSTIMAFKGSFIAAAMCSALIIIIQLLGKSIFDRFLLALNIVFIIVGIAFVVPLPQALYYIDIYKFAFMFICLAIVGLITTLFSDTGFIGVTYNNKADERESSWLLVLLTFLAAIWSFFAKDLHWAISFLIPYLMLRSFYDNFRKGLRR
jgi:hypothetical protein